MKILIVGGGGREHSIGHQLSKSPRKPELFFTPGNPGTAKIGENLQMGYSSPEALADFAVTNKIDLTVVGPEEPLFGGIVDVFQKRDLRVFGPTKAAARIESSKAFAKELMNSFGIPTARYKIFREYGEALRYVRSGFAPCFIKASGPALGKGAIPCYTLEEAEIALRTLMVEKIFGEAGAIVVIEDMLSGPEISAHFICDARNEICFPFARDHKRLLDGDQGLNTGGMGTVILPVDHAIYTQIKIGVVQRILEALAQSGSPYSGMLFPGLMQTPDGLRVLEFNSRGGDPETQVILQQLKSDLVDLFDGSIDNTLDRVKPVWKGGSTACVVMASGGYPGHYEKGCVIEGVEHAEQIPGVTVFHAGTAMKDGKLVTAGGRVLGVTCHAENLKFALRGAYAGVSRINFQGKHFRTDIGKSVVDSLS